MMSCDHLSCQIQPSNIMLDEEGHVRISDLGLAFDFVKEHHASAV